MDELIYQMEIFIGKWKSGYRPGDGNMWSEQDQQCYDLIKHDKFTELELYEILDSIGGDDIKADGSLHFIRRYKDYRLHTSDRLIMTNSPFEYMCIGIYSFLKKLEKISD